MNIFRNESITGISNKFYGECKNNRLVTNVDGSEIICEHPVVQLNENYFLVTGFFLAGELKSRFCLRKPHLLLFSGLL